VAIRIRHPVTDPDPNLVRRTLAEVCIVPGLLVLIILLKCSVRSVWQNIIDCTPCHTDKWTNGVYAHSVFVANCYYFSPHICQSNVLSQQSMVSVVYVQRIYKIVPSQ